MLKANSMNELYSMMDNYGPGQIIQVPKGLLKEIIQRTFVQNFKQSDHRITHCENKDQAQALVNFLWNEGERHKRDIKAINEDLDLLWIKWSVAPSCIREFIKP
jgi:hypothetical protein